MFGCGNCEIWVTTGIPWVEIKDIAKHSIIPRRVKQKIILPKKSHGVKVLDGVGNALFFINTFLPPLSFKVASSSILNSCYKMFCEEICWENIFHELKNVSI